VSRVAHAPISSPRACDAIFRADRFSPGRAVGGRNTFPRDGDVLSPLLLLRCVLRNAAYVVSKPDFQVWRGFSDLPVPVCRARELFFGAELCGTSTRQQTSTAARSLILRATSLFSSLMPTNVPRLLSPPDGELLFLGRADYHCPPRHVPRPPSSCRLADCRLGAPFAEITSRLCQICMHGAPYGWFVISRPS